MIYTRLSRTGEIVDVKAHGGGDISEVYGGIGETNPIYYKSRTITGTLPLSYKALGKPLSDYLIEGNTIQSGAPSADHPVDVVGCGVWDETHQSYKLPITVNGTEHPIYLGQVPTTRRIKKLVLTGNEPDYTTINAADHIFALRGIFDIAPQILQCGGYCTHYKYNNAISSLSANMRNGDFVLNVISGSSYSFTIKDDALSSSADFKSYVAAQYTAGTPVTVWYVLAEPETGNVNEPLHKIGDYADTISFAQAGVTIPTSDGDNTISFGTTVQPSAMSITGNIKEVLV